MAEIIQGPDKIVSAYDEVPVVVLPSYANEPLIVKYDIGGAGNPTKTVAISRALLASGVMPVDISYILKQAFDDISIANPGQTVDGRFAVRYTLNNSTESYWAVRRVYQLGKKGDITLDPARIMTYNNNIKAYTGYPLSVVIYTPSVTGGAIFSLRKGNTWGTVLTTAAPIATYDIVADSNGDYPNAIRLSYPNVWDLGLNFINYVVNLAGQRIIDSSKLRLIVDKANADVRNIINTCIPDSPFYIRWINDLGGLDYFMFSAKKIYQQEITNIQNIQVRQHYSANGGVSQRTIDAEGTLYVTAGINGLTKEEYDILMKLPRSPYIQHWNEEYATWESIIFSEDNSLTWDTRSGLGEVEFTFQMPRLKLQF